MSARGRIAGAFAVIYVVWGITFLAIRFVVAEIPPLATVAIRCAAGALILFAWLAARRRLESTSARQWIAAGVSGFLLFLAAHSVLAWAEIRLPSSQAALLLTAIPAWLVILEALRLRQLPSRRILVGLLLGTGGVALLTAGHAGGGGSAERIGLIFSALAWAAGSLLARHSARPASAAQATAMQLAAGAVVVTVASIATGELATWDASATSGRALGALGFLVLGGTVAGFGAYTWLLRVVTPAAVGTYAFVNPVIAVALAWMVGDDTPSRLTAVAAVLVLSAVVLINRPISGQSVLEGAVRLLRRPVSKPCPSLPA
ncbi:MAG TPA: EamA family transporter [Gemmatimonadales bacterium]|nr:EamA family transporter [Gemmatimonadales bacterium]